MRICKNCFIEKELTCFHKHPSCQDGRLWICIECIKQSRKNYFVEYRKNNKGKIAESQKRYVDSNKEKVGEYRKFWEKQNRDKVYAKEVRYKLKNKAKVKEWSNRNYKKYVDTLDDNYVKKVLRETGYTIEQIRKTPELLDIKRISIIVNRLKKIKQNESEHCNSNSKSVI